MIVPPKWSTKIPFYWTTKRIKLLKKNFHIANQIFMQITKNGIVFIVFFHKTMELP